MARDEDRAGQDRPELREAFRDYDRRTLLTSICGFAEVLEGQGNVPPQRTADYLAFIVASAAQLAPIEAKAPKRGS